MFITANGLLNTRIIAGITARTESAERRITMARMIDADALNDMFDDVGADVCDDYIDGSIWGIFI